MKASNESAVKVMIALSLVINELKTARRAYTNATSINGILVANGEIVRNNINLLINSNLEVELKLRSSVAYLCSKLDGFKPDIAERLDFISSGDIKSKCVDLMKASKAVQWIDLTTYQIHDYPREEKFGKVEKVCL